MEFVLCNSTGFLVTVKLIQLYIVDNFSALDSGDPDSNLRFPGVQTTRLPVESIGR